jgi:hypothetical protein
MRILAAGSTWMIGLDEGLRSVDTDAS